MTLTTSFYDLFILSLSNIFAQSGLIILGYLAFRGIKAEIKGLAKEMPKWIDQWDKDKMKRMAIERAKLGLQQ